jgi:two-component system, chemotaxis family, protein-glutamate methylesterase/glutaminase
MSAKAHHIVVIGTSAGGLEALDTLIGKFPTDIHAPIVIVQHMAPENTGAALLHRLGRFKAFQCALANDGEKLIPGRIYIGPPDNHLLVKGDHLLVTKGARENRYRPAIDPLFRSAAVSHGPNVIAVLLTGMLDDGTAGLIAVKKCGGLTVVQDPKDATYPEMPLSAVNNLKVDYCVPIAEMAGLIEKLVGQAPSRQNSVPVEVKVEALIAERVLSDVAQVSTLGKQVPYNCPNCGGVLWEMAASDAKRYRCHTGHSFTAPSLLTSQTERIEETLWVSLRMFEERKNLLTNMAHQETAASRKRSYTEQAKATEIHIERIRAMLKAAPPQVTERKF